MQNATSSFQFLSVIKGCFSADFSLQPSFVPCKEKKK